MTQPDTQAAPDPDTTANVPLSAMVRDRHLAPEIERATQLVRDGSLAGILRRLDDLPALWIPA